VEKKVQLTAALTKRDKALAEVERSYQPALTNISEQVAELESDIYDYCNANRASLFANKKSRETGLAEFGFELTPHRVETANKKIKWKDVVQRLLRLAWGKAYVRHPEPQPDKQAMLADREKLSEEQLTAAGIQFCQDEQFFLRPKLETAKETAEAA
jgi:phage host-nuclease inhibitor protein Gam